MRHAGGVGISFWVEVTPVGDAAGDERVFWRAAVIGSMPKRRLSWLPWSERSELALLGMGL